MFLIRNPFEEQFEQVLARVDIITDINLIVVK